MRPTLTIGWRWLGVAALVAAFALPAQAQRNVTLRVNTATLPDTTAPSIFRTDPDLAGMAVRGCLEGCTGDQSTLPDGNVIAWNDNTTLHPDHDDGDYWEVSFQIPDNEQLNFKFYSQQAETLGIGGWEDGDNNYQIAAGTGDVVRELHYFNKTGTDQDYVWRPFTADGDDIAVWFRVYMLTEDAVNVRGYDPEDPNLIVSLRGNFAENGGVGSEGPMMDWGGTEAHLTRERDDDSKPGYHLYSGLVTYPATSAGNTQNYKFYFTDTDIAGGDGGYEDGDNRSFTIPAAGEDLTLHWQYFSNSPPADPANPPVTASVTFQVDVEPLTNSGVFQTAEDMLQVRSSFNGWDCPEGNSDDCLLDRIPGMTIYAQAIPITAAPGTDFAYKYFVDFADFEESELNGYEEPLDTGGSDRFFEFEGVTQTVGPEFFNNIREGNVMPGGTSVEVTFQVDMAEAVDFASDPFDPAADSVFVQFEDGIWLFTQGYEPGDPDLTPGNDGQIIRSLTMSDPDSDLIYEGTLTLMGPSYNGIGYRYNYGGLEAEETLTVEGVGGFGPGRRRYRYVMPDGNGDFPATFELAYDQFRLGGPDGYSLPWEINPTGPFAPGELPFSIANGQDDPGITLDVEPTGGELPNSAQLGQNYPNPFNPTTVIEYALPQGGPVSLKVYDVTGRLVATLVDEVQLANNYRVNFDASQLASGVYVYQLRTATAVVSRRMTLLK